MRRIKMNGSRDKFVTCDPDRTRAAGSITNHTMRALTDLLASTLMRLNEIPVRGNQSFKTRRRLG